MAQNILDKFAPSAKLLDDMLFKLETNLGKNHTVSPFSQLYLRYGFSPAVIHSEDKKEPAKEEKANNNKGGKKEKQPVKP